MEEEKGKSVCGPHVYPSVWREGINRRVAGDKKNLFFDRVVLLQQKSINNKLGVFFSIILPSINLSIHPAFYPTALSNVFTFLPTVKHGQYVICPSSHRAVPRPLSIQHPVPIPPFISTPFTQELASVRGPKKSAKTATNNYLLRTQ